MAVLAMADRKDKRSRKEAMDRWKADQRAAARAKLPLPNEQIQALFDMLDVELRLRVAITPSDSPVHRSRLKSCPSKRS
jgi:hypothetical protein